MPLPSECLSDDSGRKWNEQCANVLKKGRAQMVSEPAIIQVHADEAAALLDRGLDFVFYKQGLCVSVVADQKDERIGASDLRGAHRLNVVGRLRVDCLIKLEIREIEINVLMGFPSAHQIVSPLVSTAEAYEGAR
jgi:hypothetical protein